MAAAVLEWLELFCERAPPREIVEAWLRTFSPAELAGVKDDKTGATRALRSAILACDRPEVRSDISSGCKFIASVMKEADTVLGVAPPKLAPKMPQVPNAATGAPSTFSAPQLPVSAESKRIRGPKLVLEGDGSPGTLGLWWSDKEGALDVARLRENKVTHRLNLAREVVGKLPDAGPEGGKPWPTVHIGMKDEFDDDEELRKEWEGQIREALELLRTWRKEGAVVNVSCLMGKNRSGVVLLVYLCSECGWDLPRGVLTLREMNPLAVANPHLLVALGDVLGVDGRCEVCAAPDGGGWICISPPGTPREGTITAKSFEDAGLIGSSLGEAAAEKLASLARERRDFGPERDDDEGEDSDAEKMGDIEPLFGDF